MGRTLQCAVFIRYRRSQGNAVFYSHIGYFRFQGKKKKCRLIRCVCVQIDYRVIYINNDPHSYRTKFHTPTVLVMMPIHSIITFGRTLTMSRVSHSIILTSYYYYYKLILNSSIHDHPFTPPNCVIGTKNT